MKRTQREEYDMIQKQETTTPFLQQTFDYGDLDDATVARFKEVASSVQGMTRMVGATVIEIGRQLDWAWNHRRPGLWWMHWLRNEIGWTDKQADEYMRAYRLFGDIDWSVAHAEPHALFELAPYQPDDPRISRAYGRLVRGDGLTFGDAVHIKHDALPEDVKEAHRIQNEIAEAKARARSERARVKRAGGARKQKEERARINAELASKLALHPTARPAPLPPPVLTSQQTGLLQMAVTNLQIALSECYGVPLRSPVGAALSRVQSISTGRRLGVEQVAALLREYLSVDDLATLKEML